MIGLNITKEEIIQLFEKSELSYREFAKKLSDSSGNVHKTIKKMKNGGSVTTKTIEKYARALGLFDEKDDK